MNTGIAHTTQLTLLQSRAARLREALAGYNAFIAAARASDPLPKLQDLACDWLHAEELKIQVPAGTAPLSCDDARAICGPVVIGRRVVGRIEARRGRPFDEDDQAMLGALGQIVGAALEYSSLRGQLEEQVCQAQAHADTLDRLLAFGRGVVRGSPDPLDLAREIVVQVPAMVGGERASLLLLPAEPEDEPAMVLSNGAVTSAERAREVCEHGLAGLVLRERAPMIIDETDTDRRWLGLRLSRSDQRTRCAMAVPLIWGERVVGALTVTTTESRLFNTVQLNLLELVACNVSLAVHTATLEARTAAVAAGLGAMATYLEAAVRELRAGNQAALATVAAVAERLRAEQQALSGE
ncbi:MAG TPA: GAF domain-containing protein [Chloroflexaceae bacterium]|nr:GAF domain-containing protein [Chloroflexaceae bacterium]